MNGLSDGVVLVVDLVALVVTLGASEFLVRGVGVLARNLGLLGGIVGLIVALGADSPEISSSISAVASGLAATAGGVVFGSNIFNLAILLSGAAFAAHEVRVHRLAVVLDAGVAITLTVAVGLAVLGDIPVPLAWLILLLVFVPYVGILLVPATQLQRLRLPKSLTRFVAQASRETAAESVELEDEIEALVPVRPDRAWRPVVLVIPALVLIVLGSFVMVQGAVTLGGRWHISKSRDRRGGARRSHEPAQCVRSDTPRGGWTRWGRCERDVQQQHTQPRRRHRRPAAVLSQPRSCRSSELRGVAARHEFFCRSSCSHAASAVAVHSSS